MIPDKPRESNSDLSIQAEASQPEYARTLTRSAITLSISPSTPKSKTPPRESTLKRGSTLKLVRVAAKSKPEEGKTAPPLSRSLSTKKVGRWKKIVACCCCCFPCCVSSRVAPGDQNQKKLEAAAREEITSKIFKGATKTMQSRGETEVIPWDYSMIAHDMQILADTIGEGGTRSDSAGEKAVGDAIVNNYKTLLKACPENKKEEFQKELVYRTIHLVEIANLTQVQGVGSAAEFRDALLASAKNFDGNENEQVEKLITILRDEDNIRKEFRSRVVGNIQSELYDAILESLEMHLKSRA